MCTAWIPASAPEADAALMVVECEKETFFASIPLLAVPVTEPVADMKSVPARALMTYMPASAPVTVAAATLTLSVGEN